MARARATWGKKDDCGVVHYIIYQLPLRLFACLKFSPILFLGDISPKEDPISLKQHVLSQILFFEKNALNFFNWWEDFARILHGKKTQIH